MIVKIIVIDPSFLIKYFINIFVFVYVYVYIHFNIFLVFVILFMFKNLFFIITPFSTLHIIASCRYMVLKTGTFKKLKMGMVFRSTTSFLSFY